MESKTHQTVEYRLVDQGELDQSIQLSLYAFQMELPESEFGAIKQELVSSQLYGCFVDGQLSAQVQVFPLIAYIQGNKFAMGGVANVASWPEHRRGGMVAGLLRLALERMRAEGQTISFLHPFSVDFYRRYGWEMYVDRKLCKIPSYLLPRTRTRAVEGIIKRVTDDHPSIRNLYEQYAAQFNGMLSRSEEWWETRIFKKRKGQLAVYQDTDGAEQGYLHYQVMNKELTIYELVTLTWEAKRALWQFIGQHESSINHVTMYAPMNDILPFGLGEPAIEQQITPYFMARIVDVEAFLRLYSFVSVKQRTAQFSTETPIDLTIEVKDDHAPWNAGVFKLTVYADGASSVERIDSSNANGNIDLEMDIQTLSALLMGYLDTQTLYELERLSGSTQAVQQLAAVIPSKGTFLSDFF